MASAVNTEGSPAIERRDSSTAMSGGTSAHMPHGFFTRAPLLALLSAAAMAYFLLNYLAAARKLPSLDATLLSLLPIGVSAAVAAWNSRARIPALVMLAAALVATGVFFDRLRTNTQWIYFFQDAGAMTSLAILFGATTAGRPEDALCSRIAIAIHGNAADADLLRYTWKVTIAWTAFFFLSALTSICLFAFGSLEAWSAFANIATPALLVAMFAGEVAVRRIALPGHADVGIGSILRAYRTTSRRDAR